MFSFDIPEGDMVADTESFPPNDPFSFNDEPESPSLGSSDFSFGKEQMSAQAKAEEDAFADLLESTSQDKVSASSVPQPDAANRQAEPSLNDFSWDDTPEIAPGAAAKPADDDFNSLFGDTDDTAKK
jgi:hypothetical protein